MHLQGTLEHTLITQMNLHTYTYFLVIKLRPIKYIIIHILHLKTYI